MSLSPLDVRLLELGIKELKLLLLPAHNFMILYNQVSAFLSLQTHRKMSTVWYSYSFGRLAGEEMQPRQISITAAGHELEPGDIV